MDWRLIVHGPADGASNMAIDEALFQGVQAGGRPVLRLYRWNPSCLSLGRNQPALGALDPRTAAARGIDIVRRPTGGLAFNRSLGRAGFVAVVSDSVIAWAAGPVTRSLRWPDRSP